MKSLARSDFWWPGLDSDQEHPAKSCQSCQAVKQAPPAAPLQPWTWPAKPWERVHIDFAGPFLSKMFLVATDAHSKWPEIFQMTQTTTSKELPLTIQHLTEQQRDWSARSKSRSKREREMDSHCNIASKFPVYISHSTTQVAPCFLFLGRSLRTWLDLMHPDIGQRVRSKQAKQEQHHDQHAHHREFQVGQRVMTRNYRSGPDWIPGTITARKGPVTFTVCVENGQLWKRHVDQLKSLSAMSPQTEFAHSSDSDTDFNMIPTTPTSNQEQSDPESNQATSPEVEISNPTSSASRYPQRNCRPPDRLMYFKF